MSDSFEDKVHALIERTLPILAEADGSIQGACIADLVAMWLASFAPHEQQSLLSAHVETVQKLLPKRAAELRERLAEQPSQHVH